MPESSRIMTGVRRGLRLRCPNCGAGHLFRGFLKVSARCEVCGADNTIYPSDDAPPYVTLVIVGHVFIPIIFWTEMATWAPPIWVLLSFWLPLIAAVTIAALPYIKGAVIGYEWAIGMTRQTARQ
jgi:uncharacterized protein (DUF983 family)